MPPMLPGYRYPAGWWAGNTALGLADLLGQGFDRLHQQNQDELGQQNRDQAFKLQLQQFLSGEQDRSSDRALKQQTADLQGKQIEDLIATRKEKADQAAATRDALGKFFQGLGQDVPTQEPAPQPPQQALAVSPQAEDRTLGQFIYGRRKATPKESIEAMGPDAANLPDKFSELLLKLYSPKEPSYASSPMGIFRKDTGEITTPSTDKFASSPQGIFNQHTGEVASPAPEKPVPPTQERDWHSIAEDTLKTTGQPYSEADIAREARKLRLEEIKAGTQTRIDLTQAASEGKEIPPSQRPNVVDQYGRPVTGSITPARIRDEGLLTLRPADAQAVAQVAQITTPFAKMLDVIEKGKLPQATGGSVYDLAQAYGSQARGTAAQYSDPDIAAYKAAQQNILFPLIRFEGGAGRQSLQELQRRQQANPSLLSTDVSAAAQAEQIAEIVETRLKTAGLTASPELQTQLDRAHEIAAKINARVSKSQGAGGSAIGGFLRNLLGSDAAPSAPAAPPGFTPRTP